jgi:hypothetical protein
MTDTLMRPGSQDASSQADRAGAWEPEVSRYSGDTVLEGDAVTAPVEPSVLDLARRACERANERAEHDPSHIAIVAYKACLRGQNRAFGDLLLAQIALDQQDGI